MTTIPTEPSRPRAGVGSPARERSRAQLWLLARRVHFMAGVLAAPFLAVLALTGLACAFTPQINDVRYGDKLYVEPQTGSPRPLSEQVGATLAAHPDAYVTSVIPAEDPDRTTRVMLGGTEGLKQAGSDFSSESLTVYVDPYTEQVTARQGWEDYPLMAKLTSIGVGALSGTLFGLAQRRPTRSRRSSLRPPVWRNLSVPMLVVVLLAAGALGWAMPVFGVALVAFVVLDGIVHTVRRRRARVSAA